MESCGLKTRISKCHCPKSSPLSGNVSLQRMPTSALIPVEEYLNTSYRPDCDYVDGRVLARNLGELDYSDLQTEIAVFFRLLGKQRDICAFVEQHVQISATRFRIPDVCVTAPKTDRADLPHAAVPGNRDPFEKRSQARHAGESGRLPEIRHSLRLGHRPALAGRLRALDRRCPASEGWSPADSRSRSPNAAA
jgi:hypothetical protein